MIYLDTDVLSYFLSGNERIYAMLKATLDKGGKIALTILTVYEVLKGLHYRQSIKKEQDFQRMLDYVQVAPLSNGSIAVAASIYGTLLSGLFVLLRIFDFLDSIDNDLTQIDYLRTLPNNYAGKFV